MCVSRSASEAVDAERDARRFHVDQVRRDLEEEARQLRMRLWAAGRGELGPLMVALSRGLDGPAPRRDAEVLGIVHDATTRAKKAASNRGRKRRR